jgi:hypothetical protein
MIIVGLIKFVYVFSIQRDAYLIGGIAAIDPDYTELVKISHAENENNSINHHYHHRYHHHHHHQLIKVPTAGAQTFLMNYT